MQEWKERISIRTKDVNEPVAEPAPSLTPYVCYGCHTTLTSRSSRGKQAVKSAKVRMPVWVSAKLDREEMKKEFEEFLIE